MPVYFLYGFRWPRPGYTGIRAFSTIYNVEDCSSDYIQNEASKAAILQVFRDQYPLIMQHLEDKDTGRTLDFIEQYEPLDESSDAAGGQPYAFVAAHVIALAAGASVPAHMTEEESEPVVGDTLLSTGTSLPAVASSSTASATSNPLKRPSTASTHPNAAAAPLCLDAEDVISQGPSLSVNASNALVELRDKIAEGAKIGWWVVYNGDPARAFIDHEDDMESESEDDSTARAEDDEPNTPSETEPNLGNDLLGQPLPSLIPSDMKDIIALKSSTQATERAENPSLIQASEQTPDPVPDPVPEQRTQAAEGAQLTSAKTNKSSFTSNFSFPLRRKSSKVSMPQPKGDDVADPATLKEINKKEGRRYKFFGGKSEKKPA